jgi:DNA-binding NarL/FixJ family response regulator
MPETCIRVLVVAGSADGRRRLGEALAAVEGVECVGEAQDVRAARRMVSTGRPHVTLLEYRLIGLRWLAGVHCLRVIVPGLRVIAVAVRAGDGLLHHLAAGRMAGALLWDTAPAEVAAAVRVVALGGIYCSSPVEARLQQLLRVVLLDRLRLTPRERQALELIGQGYDNEDLGAEMHLESQSVRNIVRGVYAKIGVSTRPELFVWLYEHGLAEPEDERAAPVTGI